MFVGIVFIAVIVSGCGFIEVENRVFSAVSIATDTPQHSLPKAVLPLTIRSTRIPIPKEKTPPALDCPKEIVTVTVKVTDTAITNPISEKYGLVLVIYPTKDGYNVELRSMPKKLCGNIPCVSTKSVGIPGVELGDRLEFVELRCVSFDKKSMQCAEFADP